MIGEYFLIEQLRSLLMKEMEATDDQIAEMNALIRDTDKARKSEMFVDLSRKMEEAKRNGENDSLKQLYDEFIGKKAVDTALTRR